MKKKSCLLFTLLLSSAVLMSCFNSRHCIKEKAIKQQLDSLISENDSLKEEKGKLIYLIFKQKGGLDMYKKEEKKIRDSLSVEDRIKDYSRLSIKDIEFILKWAKEMEDMSF